MRTIIKNIICCWIILCVFMVTPFFSYALTLEVDSNTYNFPLALEDDFDTGYIQSLRATRLTVQSGSSWRIDVKTDSVNMGGYGKPISDFLVRKNGDITFLVISDTAQELDTGSEGTHEIYVDYKALLDWIEDAPDTYSITVTYILTSQ